MFSKLGKTSLAIIYLAFAIIFLFRRARFSMSSIRLSEDFIYMIRIEKGIALGYLESEKLRVYRVTTVEATQGTVRGWKDSKHSWKGLFTINSIREV